MMMSRAGYRVLGGLGAIVAVCAGMAGLYACGAVTGYQPDGGTAGNCGDGGCTTVIIGGDSGASTPDASNVPTPPSPVKGSTDAPDCVGCTFPPDSAPACASSAPAIKIIYPNDTVLIPPNLNVISVQWTPFGGYQSYEVDFEQTAANPTTDWRVVTKCATQTNDMQTGGNGTPSGGCELTVDPLTWSKLVQANRGGSTPLTVTVRGSTDGTCATPSTNTIHMSIAEQDLIGTYYYWKSTVSANGVGGQIFAKVFGDLTDAEQNVTSAAIQNATCNGCHSLSRDGSRMVVYSDDDDSDDEYSDVAGSLLDMTPLPANPASELTGITGVRVGGQPPGFSAVHPLATQYVTSNGYPCSNGRAGTCGTATPYRAAVPTNGWALYSGANGTLTNGVTIGAAGQRPTMPDWSVDGTTLVYVQPGSVAQYDVGGQFGTRNDDMHMFGGSLYTVPYNGNGAFGTPTVFLQSNGENNYYPSYSPDQPMRFIIFNRAPLDMSAGAVTGCTTGNAPMCPNDSFSNPAARLMLIGASAAGSAPVDLEKANGSPANAPIPWSNSYPRWAPFVQSYHGQEILWFTFSSTRDYGVRVLNHKTNMYQCYPADALATPGGAHNQAFAPECQEPQLWMAPLTFTEAQSGTVDPSSVAFWVPYQDMTTHNHTAQWTEQIPTHPPPDGGVCTCSIVGGDCGTAGSCGCCAGLVCSGNNICIQVAQ
jgi:hypothetical protein